APPRGGLLPRPPRRRGPPLRRDLRIEQRAHAAEDELRQVVVRHRQPLAELAALDLPPGGSDQDLQVLGDQRVVLRGDALLELRLYLPGRLARSLQMARREIRDPIVETSDAGARGELGLELRLDLEQELRILVAALDPAAIRGGPSSRRG